MKKKTITLLMIFVFTLLCPLSAMANTSGKALFMDNIKAQQAKQIQPDFDKPVSGEINASVAGAPLDTLGVEKGQAKIKFDIDMPNNKAFFQVDANVEGSIAETINLDFYIVDDKLIIPTECLKTLTKFDPSIELPDESIKYVYTKIDDFSLTELQTIFNESKNQQEMAMKLLDVLVEGVPEKCFTSHGTTAEVKLNKLSIIDYVKNFQNPEFVEKLAEQIAALDPENTDKAQIIKDLTVSDDVSLVTLLKNLSIRKCNMEIGPSASAVDCDFGYNDEEVAMNCQVTSKSSINSNNVKSAVNVDLDIKSAAETEDITIKMNTGSTANEKESSGAAQIQLQGKLGNQSLDLVADLDYKGQYNSKVSFVAPVLTAENSIDAELLEPEKDAAVEELITINVNDYEDYIFFENAAFNENGHIMVPVREFIQNFDGEVNWKAPKSLLICTADKKISMSIGDTQCVVNDQNKEMSIAPVIKDNITYIPVRFIAEELGYKVSFDKDLLEVCLSNK